jgi:hypothetical protein
MQGAGSSPGPRPARPSEPGARGERQTGMVKALTVLALVAVSAACSSFSSSAAPASTTSVQRAVHELRHAQFGPYTGDATRPLLRDIRCVASSATRVHCHATRQGHRTKAIVFGVRPNGSLYVVAAGPLAIS